MERNLFNPEQANPFYGEIAVVYQKAFAGEPWFEVSKCASASEVKSCIGGFSSLNIGEMCSDCSKSPTEPAYEIAELTKKFADLESSRPTQWYMEKSETGITLAAFAWKETASVISQERYPDVVEMQGWLNAKLGTEPICWLDEVFANRQKKPEGNLKNFGGMSAGLASNLDCDIIAFRTINPRMVRAASRDFGTAVTVFERNVGVPDRRDFVIIKLG